MSAPTSRPARGPASRGAAAAGAVVALLGTALVVVQLWLIWFWVPTEALQGVVQRIFYLHVPSAWVAFMAFFVVALCSAMYLWLRDDRFDRAAVAAGEGGLIFTSIVLLSGPLWGKIAWGAWWVWDARLTLTLLLWFIYVGYFMVRNATDDPERGKRFAAVVGIVGAIDIPLIHLSVLWFRTQHPQPVVLRVDGPTLDPAMGVVLAVGFLAFTLLFFGLLMLRYRVETVTRHLARLDRP